MGLGGAVVNPNEWRAASGGVTYFFSSHRWNTDETLTGDPKAKDQTPTNLNRGHATAAVG
jgi:hypothetical protein